jgi:MYXO-CTERM domain-containing protein
MKADATGDAIIDVVGHGTSSPVGIVADTTPAPDRRTFGVYFSEGSALEDDQYLNVVRVRSQSGAVVTPTLGDRTSSRSVMASDGTLMLAVSKDYLDNTGVDALLIDPVAGAFKTSSAVVIDPGSTALPPLTAWFDGFSYAVMTRSNSNPFELRLRRLTPDLKLLDAPKAASGVMFEPQWLSADQQSIAAASDGTGRSLVVYTEPDPQFHAMSIKARFVDNDGTPSSSTGGAGGAASTSTALPASGGTGSGGNSALVGSGGRSASTTTSAATASSGGSSAGGTAGGGVSNTVAGQHTTVAPTLGGYTSTTAVTTGSSPIASGGVSSTGTGGGSGMAQTASTNFSDAGEVSGNGGASIAETSAADGQAESKGSCACRAAGNGGGSPTAVVAVLLLGVLLSHGRFARRDA